MKKFLCALLSIMMLASLVTAAVAEAPAGYKIAIITGTTTQGEEEFRAAEALQAAYPDIVVTATYPDNFSSEIETTKSRILDFAFDPDVKAIIMCQAVPGCAPAYQEIREMRDDILLLAGVPQEAPATASAANDFCFQADDPAQGHQIVETLQKWGVDVFIHYSFPRHMAMETIVARHTILKADCEAAGIEFVDRTAPDPTAEAGATASHQYILEDVPAVMTEYAGKKVAFYTTNCGMQEPLQTAVLAQPNAYYPLPCCPSPYHAFPASMEIGVTAESYGDPAAMLKEIASVLKGKDALGRFSTWAEPLNMTFIKVLFDYATRYINGEVTDKNNLDEIKVSLKNVTGSDDIGITTYTDAEGNTYENYYMLVLPPVDFNDYV